jgi:HTH-type transcriptional regulator/antitoxin HigA
MARVRQDPESPAAQLKAMIKDRGWSQADLAYIMGINVVTINQAVNNKRAITAELAKLLGVAFGCGPEFFMDMQTKWYLRHVPDPGDDVRARAYAHSRFPLREMAKRGWINDIAGGANAHAELCRFFNVNSLERINSIGHSFRKSGDSALSGQELAWLYRVHAIAKEMTPPRYSKAALEAAIARMSMMREDPEEIRHVAKLLHEAGVRFVVAEGLPDAKVDGVCTWLHDNSPVIGMSLRLDRIDNFWFVLRHECAHVLHEHGKSTPMIDSDISADSQDVDTEEKMANAEAADFCVPSDKMKSFFLRKQPFFSEIDVRSFAKIHQVHPGIVVGQLQNVISVNNVLRHHLVSIRKYVTASALTDGWGQTVSVG